MAGGTNAPFVIKGASPDTKMGVTPGIKPVVVSAQPAPFVPGWVSPGSVWRFVRRALSSNGSPRPCCPPVTGSRDATGKAFGRRGIIASPTPSRFDAAGGGFPSPVADDREPLALGSPAVSDSGSRDESSPAKKLPSAESVSPCPVSTPGSGIPKSPNDGPPSILSAAIAAAWTGMACHIGFHNGRACAELERSRSGLLSSTPCSGPFSGACSVRVGPRSAPSLGADASFAARLATWAFESTNE